MAAWAVPEGEGPEEVMVKTRRTSVLLLALCLGGVALPSAPAGAAPEGPLRLLSANAGGTAAGNDQSQAPQISGDGRYVVFVSEAGDLIAGLTDNHGNIGAGADVYRYDRLDGSLRLVSHAQGQPTATGNGDSSAPNVTPDGRYVAYVSRAANLVLGAADAENDPDVFVWDAATGTTVLASRTPGNAPTPCTALGAGSQAPSISDDGQRVAFQSDCANLTATPDANAAQDTFLWSRADGAGRRARPDPAGSRRPVLDPRVSAEIRRVSGADAGGAVPVLTLGGEAAVSPLIAQEARLAAGNADCAAPLPATCRFAGGGREETAT